MNRRVAWVIPYPNYGGPLNEFARTAELLRARGWEPIAVAPMEDGDGIDALLAAGEVHRIGMQRFRSGMRPAEWRTKLGGLRSEVGSLRHLLEGLRVDVVRVNGLHNPEGALASPAPVVWAVMSDYTPRPLRPAGVALFSRYADVGLITGRSLADVYPGLRATKVPLIEYLPPMTTDEPAPRPSQVDHRPLRIVMVGTIGEQKDQKLAVAILGDLLERGVDATLTIVGAVSSGHPRYGDELQADIDHLGIGDRVERLGHRDDVGKVLDGGDLYLSTSRAEGVPASIMEAMAHGLPVVAPRVGAISDVVVHSTHGFVVPRERRDLVDAVEHVYRHPDTRAAMGMAAAAHAANHFGNEVTADRFAEAFDLAASPEGRRRGQRRSQ